MVAACADVKKYHINNLRSLVNENMSTKTAGVTIAKGDIHFRISSFCDTMAYSNAEQTSLFMYQLQNVLRTLSNIDALM